MKRLILLTALFATAAALARGTEGACRFPPALRGASPDGKWALICKNPTGHVFTLLRNASGRSIDLLDSDRDCDILWRPDNAKPTLLHERGAAF